jgi:hypothetical protein
MKTVLKEQKIKIPNDSSGIVGGDAKDPEREGRKK